LVDAEAEPHLPTRSDPDRVHSSSAPISALRFTQGNKLMKRLSLLAAFVLALLAPLAAQASDGYITRDLNLRTGPDVDYPRITMIEAGTSVEVLGCIDRWTWCDVAVYGERGWVSGRYVQLEYQGHRGYVSSYGYNVGIPILAFSLGTYWGEHYHDRPWYEHRDSWASSSHGHRPNYTYSYQTQYNRQGSGYNGTSSTYRNGTKVAPVQTTSQRSGTYEQSRTQSSGYRSGSQVVSQPTQQSSYSKQQRRDSSRDSRNQAPVQTRETATQVERSASYSSDAQQPSHSNGRGAQGPQRSEQVHTQEGHSSNARAPQGPVRGQGHAAEHTQVARQDQPAAQPHEKNHPQNNGTTATTARRTSTARVRTMARAMTRKTRTTKGR
jgi:uncharacterized protein YraI